MTLHAPLALIAGLFASTFLWIAPQGGLDAHPVGIVSDAAQGAVSWDVSTGQLAHFD